MVLTISVLHGVASVISSLHGLAVLVEAMITVSLTYGEVAIVQLRIMENFALHSLIAGGMRDVVNVCLA